MIPVICIDPLFPDLAPHRKIEKIAAQGFTHVEFWGWRDKDIPALAEACRRSRVKVVNFSGHRVGSPVAKTSHQAMLDDLEDAVKAARILNCPTLMMLTNALDPDGAVTDAFENIPDRDKYAHTVAGLKKALEQTPEEITLVLEPLNIQVDHPGYFLTDMKTASAIIEDVGHHRLKILCDLYHLGMMGADLETVVNDHLDHIGYFHVADFPGRHEPGTGSADWPFLLGLIKEKGYRGYVGFEYFPSRDPEASLVSIRRLWETIAGEPPVR